MALVKVKDLLKAGVHYGHKTSRWNPKMKPFLFGKRNAIHIIDLAETVKGLYRAYKFLEGVARDGNEVIFVGTKRPAQKIVREEAVRCGMHFVRTRWIGGSLTNFNVVRSRLDRWNELERLEETGDFAAYSKKMMSTLMREKRKIARNLEGIRYMDRMPGAIVVVDPSHEDIAVREARKKGIPVIGLTDSNCDPEDVDIMVPCNDDAMKSIRVIIAKLADAVLAGRDGEPGPTSILMEQAAAGERIGNGGNGSKEPALAGAKTGSEGTDPGIDTD